MESLCYPAGAALARLTVHCLAATIKMKTSGPYTTKKRKYRYTLYQYQYKHPVTNIELNICSYDIFIQVC